MERKLGDFIRVRVIFIYFPKTYKYWHSQKHTSCLLTHLYDQVYFDRKVEFDPSMYLNDTWSDNSQQEGLDGV